MKKLLMKTRYLLAFVCLMLLGTNVALAQSTTLFDYTVSEGDDPTNATATVGTVGLGASKVEKHNDLPNYAFKCDGDLGKAGYIKGTLASNATFAVGDEISMTIACTSAPSDTKKFGISIYDGTTSDANLVGSLYCTKKTTEETFSYTIKENDALIGKPDFYLFRAAGQSTYVISVKVTRTTTGDEEEGSQTYNVIKQWDFTSWSEATIATASTSTTCSS